MRPTTRPGKGIQPRKRRSRAGNGGAFGAPQLQVPSPQPIILPGPDPSLRLRRRRFEHVDLRFIGLVAFAVVVVVGLLAWAWSATRVHARMTGIEDGAALRPEQAQALKLRIEVSPGGRVDEATLEFDGRDVLEEATVRGDVIRWAPGALEDGEHRLRLTVPRPVLPDAELTWAFTVDGRPPSILVPAYLAPHEIDEPVEIDGRVEGTERLLVNGKPFDLERDGSFALRYERPPAGAVELTAEDAAGNRRTARVSVPIPYRNVHGIHVTAHAWNNPTSRQTILGLIDAGLIDTVQLDIKDEGGVIGHRTDVPLARSVGASQDLYDLKRQVDLLHEKGAWVVGRIVAFRDPTLAKWAWENDRRDLVIQTPEGDRYAAYEGGFTSFASRAVQNYNIDLAVEAAEAGVDDIMYDYVRRPEGDLAGMVVPELRGDPEDAVIGFLSRSHERLRKLGTYQGAAVLGVAASRPEQIAQNILGMAYETDYIAPMLYPDHWNPGEYGIPDPERDPYEIVKRSLRDFQQQVTRTGRPVVLWIRHYPQTRANATNEIVAQVRAAKDMGFDSWMMWNSEATYDVAALERSR